MDFKPGETCSISFLMEAAMLWRAIENLAGHQAFAARQVNAALSTTHHIFAAGRAARGGL
jgi:hypothetical protein